MAAHEELGAPEKVSIPASGHKSLVEHLEDEDDTSTYAILMPAEYTMKEGSQLWKGVRLGKFLGAGAQAKVFQLAHDDGSPIGKVIKVNHGDLGSKMLNNNVLWVGMDREWEVGTQLRAALQQPGGQVPGFMKVADCLIAGKNGQEHFSGMLMEELHGFEVYKRIDVPEFHNIHYVREMLFQSFSALDRAQRKVGFHHADLGMRNIMEHYPQIWEQLPAEEGEKAKAKAKQFPGYSCNADGSRLPLGPQLEFKIIDFGIAKFSAKLAAAAAGSEAEEIVERLNEQQRTRMRFGNANSPATIEYEPSDVTKHKGFMARLKNMISPSKSRLTVIIRPVKKLASVKSRRSAGPGGAAAAATDEEAAVAEEGGVVEEAALQAEWEPIRLASFQDAGFKQAADAVAEHHKEAAGSKKKKKKKRKSPIETMYRHFWHRKGDAFHLLLGIALALDDRCWPEEDEDEVAALCSLVHHVTGVKMRVRTAEGEPGSAAFGRHKWQHWFRRWHIRLKGHILPYNSGLLAREALSHPFFTRGDYSGLKHASLPAELPQVFPTE
ncbi:expressed protein [Chlorella variabilis]|uniref:Expressed protein n=1 Tax=Chlorella variabilis TaxID=554065 RepID=E1ZCX3_CHLVA|nr:expressed protein [Chlorella variabilis]EFN56123.1 expressed protein [Chlorella variabilis]|eukprot:XP_005848225.1 expressed protein [Chlorella variabilis]